MQRERGGKRPTLPTLRMPERAASSAHPFGGVTGSSPALKSTYLSCMSTPERVLQGGYGRVDGRASR